jgi:tetratricopeptide (TPR) repeat protein
LHEEREPTPAAAIHFLRNNLHDRAVLLVVDNLPADADAADLPIVGGKSRTIITSRAVDWDLKVDVPLKTLRLEHWLSETSREYLRKVVPRLKREHDDDLDALSEFVGGLPLAIRLIAVSLARQRARSAKEHLAKLRAEPLGTLDQFRGSDRGVASTFLETYNALRTEDRTVLCALAACANGTRASIVADVADIAEPDASAALNRLADVSLAEFRDGAFAPWGLHDVVRLFVRAQVEAAKAASAHLAWVERHLRTYADPTDHERLEEGMAETTAALERSLTAKDAVKATELLRESHEHLFRKGRYGLLIEYGERLLSLLPSGSEHIPELLGRLGTCYRTTGDLRRAITTHERALDLYRSGLMFEGQARELSNLGICFRKLDEIEEKAIGLHRSALAIYQDLGNTKEQEQAIQLTHLGDCYGLCDQIATAIDFHERALTIFTNLGPSVLKWQAYVLCELGSCYRKRLGPTKQRSPDSASDDRDSDDRRDEEIARATAFHRQSLEIVEQIDYPEVEANNLSCLALCRQELHDFAAAIKFHKQSLAIEVRLGRLEGQANDLDNLGDCYDGIFDRAAAADHWNRSLALYRRILRNDQHQRIRQILAKLEAPSAHHGFSDSTVA